MMQEVCAPEGSNFSSIRGQCGVVAEREAGEELEG